MSAETRRERARARGSACQPPRLNGLKYFEKPALQYWATALSY